MSAEEREPLTRTVTVVVVVFVVLLGAVLGGRHVLELRRERAHVLDELRTMRMHRVQQRQQQRGEKPDPRIEQLLKEARESTMQAPDGPPRLQSLEQMSGRHESGPDASARGWYKEPMARRSTAPLPALALFVGCSAVAPAPRPAPYLTLWAVPVDAAPATAFAPAVPPPATFALAPAAGGHPHHLALFLGWGTEERSGNLKDKGPAVGAEYEYRFDERWGVGGVVETLGRDTIRQVAFVAPVSYHPGGGPWRLFGGPGFEITEKKDKWLVRLGAGYEIALDGGWSLAPELLVDLIEAGENVWVLGFAIGKGF